jgi:hypothetical protein
MNAAAYLFQAQWRKPLPKALSGWRANSIFTSCDHKALQSLWGVENGMQNIVGLVDILLASNRCP